MLPRVPGDFEVNDDVYAELQRADEGLAGCVCQVLRGVAEVCGGGGAVHRCPSVVSSPRRPAHCPPCSDLQAAASKPAAAVAPDVERRPRTADDMAAEAAVLRALF